MKITVIVVGLIVGVPVLCYLAGAIFMPGWSRGRDGRMYYSTSDKPTDGEDTGDKVKKSK